MQDKLKLPNCDQIDLIYVVAPGGKVSQYYNGIRRGRITEEHSLARDYRSLLPRLVATFVGAIEASGVEFDTLVLAPSSRQDAVPFMEAIVQRWPGGT